MSYFNAVHDYYAGQQIVSIAGALVALVLVLLAWSGVRRSAHPAHAFGMTVLVIAGGFMLPANVAYFIYVGPQSARVESMLSRSTAEFHASEEAHLNTLMRGLEHSYAIDGTLAMLGIWLAVFGVFVRSDQLVGTGLAVSLCAITLLTGEVWSKSRAQHYRDALQIARDGGQ